VLTIVLTRTIAVNQIKTNLVGTLEGMPKKKNGGRKEERGLEACTLTDSIAGAKQKHHSESDTQLGEDYLI
jgi:hypothetical protein